MIGMGTLISVIIPVYNVEQYLHECINSIINQTYKNLEIILVDDGSTDSCGKICDSFAAKDRRITVIHKRNGGLSDARNAGLKLSTGGYIVFVDSDDYMLPDGIEYLYKLASENDADIVIGGTEKFEDETGEIIWTSGSADEAVTILTKTEAIKDVFIRGCASWARIYKRQIHSNIYFPVGEINEDEAIVLELMDKCSKVVKTDKIVYRYRYRTDSITSSRFHTKKMAWYNHCKTNLKFVEEKYPELTEFAEMRYYSSMIWCLNNMTIDVKAFRYEIRTIRKELRIGIKDFFNNGYITNKEKLRGFLLAYFYYLYAAIVKLLGKHYT